MAGNQDHTQNGYFSRRQAELNGNDYTRELRARRMLEQSKIVKRAPASDSVQSSPIPNTPAKKIDYSKMDFSQAGNGAAGGVAKGIQAGLMTGSPIVGAAIGGLSVIGGIEKRRRAEYNKNQDQKYIIAQDKMARIDKALARMASMSLGA